MIRVGSCLTCPVGRRVVSETSELVVIYLVVVQPKVGGGAGPLDLA